MEDIPTLAERFLGQLAERLGRPKKRLGEAALRGLMRHSFAGNVRELKSALEQAAVLAEGEEIEEAELGLAASESDGAPVFAPGVPFAEAKRRAIEGFERKYLSDALSRHDGNVSRTAEALGMARQSLQQKLRELGLRGNDPNRERE